VRSVDDSDRLRFPILVAVAADQLRERRVNHPAVIAAVSAIVSFVVAFIVVRLLDKRALRDAETLAREIRERADRDAATRIKEAALEIKENALLHKAAMEKELNKVRGELRERERLLGQTPGDARAAERRPSQTREDGRIRLSAAVRQARGSRRSGASSCSVSLEQQRQKPCMSISGLGK
jgi:ribonucrease Y